MEDIKKLLEIIVSQLDKQQEHALVVKLNADDRDVTLSEIHSSIDGVREAVLEVEYKLDQIELRLGTLEQSYEHRRKDETT